MLTFKQLRKLREALKPAIKHLYDLSSDNLHKNDRKIASKAYNLLYMAESLAAWTLAAEDSANLWETEDL